MPNVFEILDCPVRFDLDTAALQRRYLQLSAAHHPDRFADPDAQAEAAERAAAINQAYQILRIPERRAEALLILLGGTSSSTDKSLPPELLMQMMEVREELEQALASHDQATLNRLRTWARAQRTERLQHIGQILAQFFPPPDALAAQPSSDREALLKQARLELNALRYFQRMLEQLPG